jgi:cytochrome c1
MRAALLSSVALCVAMGSARAQDATAGDIRKGHDLASTVCAICHVGAPDQAHKPLMNPPAPSFESIAQRKDINADSLRKFITTTHRGLDSPVGMPNPDLMDFQVKDVVAYILSLRK